MLIGAVIALSLTGATTVVRPRRDKAFFADPSAVAFVRPGLVFKVTGAQIASDGTITATLSVTDPQGAPLDRTGVTTPGAVSISLIAATIPKGQTQYTAYTTRVQTSPITKVSATQAGADTGGSFTQVSDGVYRYTFGMKAPAGFDASATHTIGVYGSRSLTDFGLGTNYASTTFNFVPNGSPVTVTRDVVRTQTCDTCHDQLSAHGGSRRGVEMCVLCHQPQTIDPDTGNTVNLAVMVHKLHAGSTLPSVIAGKPYQIIGFNQTVTDWSSVVYPADVRRCETCHNSNSGAAQATAHLTRPSRVACGACHDDVNFATGDKHAGGPQFDDNLCSTCHIPQGEIDFDASIKGGHVIPAESKMLSGLAVDITKVGGGTAGSAPSVSFTLKDSSGSAVPLSSLGALTFTLAGPTADYGYTSFGSDVTTPGYVSESATTGASCGGDGACLYTFKHAIPAQAKGTYSIGVEARRTETLLPGTTKQMTVTYGAPNKVLSFAVDGSTIQPRRAVVTTAKCNQCHASLSVHGSLRNQTEYCVLCHNPSNTDASTRANAQNAADKAQPPQGVNFPLLVHRIHTGENLTAMGGSYTVVGFGGSHNDFSDVRFPPMSRQGAPGDTRNCAMCHVNGSEQNLPTGLNDVVNPQYFINPAPAVTAACTACHITKPVASHAAANTTSFGESCDVCHSALGDFNISKVHAQ